MASQGWGASFRPVSLPLRSPFGAKKRGINPSLGGFSFGLSTPIKPPDNFQGGLKHRF
jgi:hypothetical protein